MATEHEQVGGFRGQAAGPSRNIQTNNVIPGPRANNDVFPGPAVGQETIQHVSMGYTSPYRTSEAYLLWLLFGFLGFHHFYLNRLTYGLMYFLTLGLLGVGYVIDMFRLPCLVREANQGLVDPTSRNKATLSDAFTLWFPLGLIGLHHFYLRRHICGVMYFFTVGLFGFGWLVDLFRMPSLVMEANNRPQKQPKELVDSFCLTLPPFGLFGAHHFYLGRRYWGLYHLLTLGGGLGLGWIIDLFRMYFLVERANNCLTDGQDNRRHLDDAYLLWLPFGILGFHHFYLDRPVLGGMYMCTFGLLGIGWLLDGIKMPWLVNECNKQRLEAEKADRAERTTLLHKPREKKDQGSQTNIAFAF